jgi:hypothetical protein
MKFLIPVMELRTGEKRGGKREEGFLSMLGFVLVLKFCREL